MFHRRGAAIRGTPLLAQEVIYLVNIGHLPLLKVLQTLIDVTDNPLAGTAMGE